MRNMPLMRTVGHPSIGIELRRASDSESRFRQFEEPVHFLRFEPVTCAPSKASDFPSRVSLRPQIIRTLLDSFSFMAWRPSG